MKFTVIAECGEKTCAVEPGKFCRFVLAIAFGTKPICTLYSVQLWEVNGWLWRCEKCLEENIIPV